MAYIDFDPEDYLDEISTDKLIKELRSRGEDARDEVVSLLDDMEDAFRAKDAAHFDIALMRLRRCLRPERSLAEMRRNHAPPHMRARVS